MQVVVLIQNHNLALPQNAWARCTYNPTPAATSSGGWLFFERKNHFISALPGLKKVGQFG